jgi:hypothetical protein
MSGLVRAWQFSEGKPSPESELVERRSAGIELHVVSPHVEFTHSSEERQQ